MKPSKKLMLVAAGSLTAAGVGAWLYASRYETRNYKLDSLDIDTADGGVANASSLRILHISDLHLAKPESHKIDFLRRITDQDFDMIVLTGDVFEDHSGLEYISRTLSRKPRLGAYAVLGNHDYYDYKMMHKILGRLYRPLRHPSVRRDAKPFVDALAAAGFTVLSNSAVTHSNEKVFVAGLDYFGISDENLNELIGTAPNDHTVIALQHVPHNLSRFPEVGIDVAFCGHTHGGQVRIPGFGAIITDSELARSEASGLLRRGKTAIYVSRGLGADPRSNFRFFCPPHATIINVHRTLSAEGAQVIDINARAQKR